MWPEEDGLEEFELAFKAYVIYSPCTSRAEVETNRKTWRFHIRSGTRSRQSMRDVWSVMLFSGETALVVLSS